MLSFCICHDRIKISRLSTLEEYSMTQDQLIMRELAKQYVESASSEKQQRANKRMLDTNDLKVVRPPVLINEIPWKELLSDPELTLHCEDPRARRWEEFMRQKLYCKKHFHADVIMPSYIGIQQAYSTNPVGVERVEIISESNGKRFEDVLADESSVDLINDLEIWLCPERDEQAMNYHLDLFGDSIPVKLTGPAKLHEPIWDRISFLRGVEPIYEDLYDRPEHLHRIMQKLAARTIGTADFIEKNISLPGDPYDLHCTPGMISGRGEKGLKSMWFRGMAQLFSCISPEMFKEFELDYIKPIAERCAYTYYGCCEPLHDRIDVLKSIKNLRKIGVSPWADIYSSAEQIGSNYVYSRKPNPAFVASKTDPDTVRKETEEAVKACIKFNCPADFVLKDITTISGNPENLAIWAETVQGVMDEYYGIE